MARQNGLTATIDEDAVALGLLDNTYSPTVVELYAFLGPLALSVSLGHPGEIEHPEVQEALETVRERAVEAGVPVGGLGFGTDDVNQKTANGYQILHVGSTTGVLQQTITGCSTSSRGSGRI